MSQYSPRPSYPTSNKMEQAFENATKLLKGKLVSPYQEVGVRWMLDRELSTVSHVRGGFLCDEMGLGKTIQLIAVMLGNPKNKTLIVCPKSLIPQWKNEIKKFAPYFIFSSELEDLEKVDIFLTNYATFARQKITPKCGRLMRFQWDRIIIDEAHEIRNYKGSTNKNMRALKATHKWAVTGTPIYNSMKDFVALSAFLGWDPRVTQVSSTQIRNNFLIRRTKEDVSNFDEALKLPNCHFENIEVPMYPEEEAMYTEVFEDAQQNIEYMLRHRRYSGMDAMYIFEYLLRCRQLMIHPSLYYKGMALKEGTPYEPWDYKVKKLEVLIKNIMSHPEEKTLVFCHFVEEMRIIAGELHSMGLDVFVLDGSLSSLDREEQIQRFRETKEQSVFIIQIKTGGVGLNLQEATRVYLTSPSWNPATELQAIARCHRKGQTKSVTVKKLISTPTGNVPSIEESMMTLQGHKSIVCSEVLNDPRLVEQIPLKLRKINKNPTITEIAKLFSKPKNK